MNIPLKVFRPFEFLVVLHERRPFRGDPYELWHHIKLFKISDILLVLTEECFTRIRVNLRRQGDLKRENEQFSFFLFHIYLVFSLSTSLLFDPDNYSINGFGVKLLGTIKHR